MVGCARLRLSSRLAAALVVASALVFAIPGIGVHANYAHLYSKTLDAGTTPYSGVSVQRFDSFFNLPGVSSSLCGQFAAPIAYQTMWVVGLADSTSNTWVEEGTAHQNCNPTGQEYKWWFGWINNGTVSAPLFVQVISGAELHRFFLTNDQGDGNWRWYIDSSLFYTYYWPNLGTWDQAGLETYDDAASAPEHCYCGIVKQVNWSGWQAWAPTSTSVDSGMSGSASANNQDWYASEP